MLEVFIGFALYAPTNKKRHAELGRLKVWAVEALPFPASGSPTARICQGKLTTDGILSCEKTNSSVYAAYSPFTPPPIRKDTQNCVSLLIGGGGRARTYDLYHVKVAL